MGSDKKVLDRRGPRKRFSLHVAGAEMLSGEKSEADGTVNGSREDDATAFSPPGDDRRTA